MCVNFSATRKERMQELFPKLSGPVEDCYKEQIFPGDLAPVIRRAADGQLECVLAMFGMVPHWAQTSLARHTYNARSETVADKPSFRQAWQAAQFCLIVADAFYEPRYVAGKAERCRLAQTNGQPVLLAGIWECNPKLQGLLSFSMLTINADLHPFMSQFHQPGEEKRMPVILDAEQQLAWLNAKSQHAQELLQAWPADLLVAQAVPSISSARRAKVAAVASPQASLF